MKKKDIEIGKLYVVSLCGKRAVVKLVAREECPYGEGRDYKGPGYTIYHCINIETGKSVQFRTSVNFKRPYCEENT